MPWSGSLTFVFPAEAMRNALTFLISAEKDYENLEMYSRLQDVQFFLSVIYQNLSMPQKRDAAATRHQNTCELRKKVEAESTEEWVSDVWELVADIGSALAAR